MLLLISRNMTTLMMAPKLQVKNTIRHADANMDQWSRILNTIFDMFYQVHIEIIQQTLMSQNVKILYLGQKNHQPHPNESFWVCLCCPPGAHNHPSVTRMTQEASDWSAAAILASDWSRLIAPDITGVSASSRMSTTAAFIKPPAAAAARFKSSSFLQHSQLNYWSKKIISCEERALDLGERFKWLRGEMICWVKHKLGLGANVTMLSHECCSL